MSSLLQNTSRDFAQVSFFGLNPTSAKIAERLAKRQLVYEFDLEADFIGMQVGQEYIIVQGEEALAILKETDIYYINGSSETSEDWNHLKSSLTALFKTITYNNKLVFGPAIQPELVEVILLDLISEHSGLKLGMGFDIAFANFTAGQAEFKSIKQELKLSHNQIIDEVQAVLNGQGSGVFEAQQLVYGSLESEFKFMQSKINDLWVPMLNQMTVDTFEGFLNQVVNNNYLDEYQHLKVSNEKFVDWHRFFKLAVRGGLLHSLESLTRFSALRKVV